MYKLKDCPTPKYYQMKKILSGEISSGKLKHGDKFYSENELAKMFSVSTMTARQALKELANENLIFSKRGSGTFICHKYIPNKKTNSILIISCRNIESDGYSLFASETLYGIQTAVYKNQIKLEYHHSPETCSKIPQQIKEKQVDGIILVNSHKKELIEALKTTELPMVQTEEARADLISISTDNYQGAYLATEHLIKLNRKKILHIDFELGVVSSSKKRKQGYKDALKKHGIKFDENLIIQSNYSFDTTIDAFGKYLKNNKGSFDAVFAQNDEMALAAIQVLTNNGIKVPEDIPVIGFDDLQLSRMTCPALSTIKNDCHQIGFLAVKTLLKIINKKAAKSIVLKPELIVRKSTV